MFTSNYNNFLFNFVNKFKNLYGHFWRNSDGFYEYYLKLDCCYYSKWKKCLIAVIRLRNKRIADKIPIGEIVNDKEYIIQLHPLDACTIGIFANNERNGIIDKDAISWQKINRLKEYKCNIKSEPILQINNKYIEQTGEEVVVLYSKILNRTVNISVTELCKNQALLYAIGSNQAISIGYDVSESFIRNQLF
jgi:hypothetical protein